MYSKNFQWSFDGFMSILYYQKFIGHQMKKGNKLIYVTDFTLRLH